MEEKIEINSILVDIVSKYGCQINSIGYNIIEKKYVIICFDFKEELYENYYRSYVAYGVYGIDGKEIIPCNNYYIEYANKNIFIVETNENTLKYINSKNKQIGPEFENRYSLNNFDKYGIAECIDFNTTRYIVNTKGNYIDLSETDYEISDFYMGYAKISKNNGCDCKIKYINKNFEEIKESELPIKVFKHFNLEDNNQINKQCQILAKKITLK